MTSAPTSVPSADPSSAPTSTIPTAPPSLSGWVATVTASTITTSKLDADTLQNYAASIAESYGVGAADVSTSVTYSASGTMSIAIPEGSTQEQLTEAIKASLSESLGIHPQNVEVKVDMLSGEVTFTISSNDFNAVQSAKFDLENEVILREITSKIESEIPESKVTNVSVSPDTRATVEFIVDADNAKNDLTQAAWQTENLLSDFDVEIKSKFLFAYNFC